MSEDPREAKKGSLSSRRRVGMESHSRAVGGSAVWDDYPFVVLAYSITADSWFSIISEHHRGNKTEEEEDVCLLTLVGISLI